MAIIQTGVASGVAGGNLIIDPAFQASRSSERPPECLGSYSTTLVSGLNVAATFAGANTSTGTLYPIFSFRWAPVDTTKLCMIRRVEVSFSTTTAFTAAQAIQVMMVVARNFSANLGTVGFSTTFTQSNTTKLRTSMPQTNFVTGGQIAISGTAVMTAGTYVADTQYMSSVVGASTGLGTGIPTTPIFQHQTGDYPLIFASNEGFILSNGLTFGAAGVGAFMVNVEWMELAATTGNAIAY